MIGWRPSLLMRVARRKVAVAMHEQAEYLTAVTFARKSDFAGALKLVEGLKAGQRRRDGAVAYTRLLRLERVCRLGVGDKPGLRDVLTELFLLAGDDYSEGAALAAARNLARAHFDCDEPKAVLALSEHYPKLLGRSSFSGLFTQAMQLLGAEALLVLGEYKEAKQRLSAVASTEFDLATSAEAVANHTVSSMLVEGFDKAKLLASRLKEAMMLAELASFEPLIGPVAASRDLITEARATSRELVPGQTTLTRKETSKAELSAEAASSAAPSSSGDEGRHLSPDLEVNYALRDQMLTALSAEKIGEDPSAFKLRNPRSVAIAAALTRLYLEVGDPQQTFRWCNVGLTSAKGLHQLDAMPFLLYIAFLMFGKAGLRRKAEENLRFCIEAASARKTEHLKLAVLSYLDLLKGEGRWFELYEAERQLADQPPWGEGLGVLRHISQPKLAQPMLVLPQFEFR